MVIVGLGVIAALNQIGVATTVTTPVLIAVLATGGGVIVVGVGGGDPAVAGPLGVLAAPGGARRPPVIAEQGRAYGRPRGRVAAHGAAPRDRAAQLRIDSAERRSASTEQRHPE